MKEYELKLLRAKHSMEENMDKLDDAANILTKEMEKMEEDLIAHVRKAKNIAVEKLAKATKTSKEKINKSTESVDDQIQCIKKCQQTLTDINTTSDMLKQVAEFFRTKEIDQKLQSSSIKEVLIMSKVKKGCDVGKIKKQWTFPSLEHSECTQSLNSDIWKATLKVDKSFSVDQKEILFGAFLMDGSIFFPQYRPFDYFSKSLCLLFNRDGKQIKRFSTDYTPLAVCQDSKEIYVSCGISKVIIVLSSETFKVVRCMATKKNMFWTGHSEQPDMCSLPGLYRFDGEDWSHDSLLYSTRKCGVCYSHQESKHGV